MNRVLTADSRINTFAEQSAGLFGYSLQRLQAAGVLEHCHEIEAYLSDAKSAQVVALKGPGLGDADLDMNVQLTDAAGVIRAGGQGIHDGVRSVLCQQPRSATWVVVRVPAAVEAALRTTSARARRVETGIYAFSGQNLPQATRGVLRAFGEASVAGRPSRKAMLVSWIDRFTRGSLHG